MISRLDEEGLREPRQVLPGAEQAEVEREEAGRAAKDALGHLRDGRLVQAAQLRLMMRLVVSHVIIVYSHK